MKMQKKTGLGGPWAKKKPYEYQGKQYEADIKDGDIVTILDSGTQAIGEHGEQTVFKIETRNGEKNFAFNQGTINNMIDAYGDDSDRYIGKQVKVFAMKAMVSGKMQIVAYLADKNAVMDDEGRFSIPGKSTDKSADEKFDELGPIEYDDIPE